MLSLGIRTRESEKHAQDNPIFPFFSFTMSDTGFQVDPLKICFTIKFSFHLYHSHKMSKNDKTNPGLTYLTW